MGRAEAVAIALWACPGHRRPWAGSSPQASAGWCWLWFEWFKHLVPWAGCIILWFPVATRGFLTAVFSRMLWDEGRDSVVIRGTAGEGEGPVPGRRHSSQVS